MRGIHPLPISAKQPQAEFVMGSAAYPPPFTGEVSRVARRRGDPRFSPLRPAALRLLGTSPASGGGKRLRKRRHDGGSNRKAGRRGEIPTQGSPARTPRNSSSSAARSRSMCGWSKRKLHSCAPPCPGHTRASSTKSCGRSAVMCVRCGAAQDARRIAGSTRMESPKRARKRSMSTGSIATVSESPSARSRRLTTRPCL